MSTGAECVFYEKKPNRWYYKLQRYPYGYTEDYDHFGPFTTRSKAGDHLRANHANPGGSNTDVHKDHVHTYKEELRYGDDEPQDICTGCDQRKPVEMPCGCIDWHKKDCDEYELHISFKITAKKAQLLIDGDESTRSRVAAVAALEASHQLKRLKSDIARGW